MIVISRKHRHDGNELILGFHFYVRKAGRIDGQEVFDADLENMEAETVDGHAVTDKETLDEIKKEYLKRHYDDLQTEAIQDYDHAGE